MFYNPYALAAAFASNEYNARWVRAQRRRSKMQGYRGLNGKRAVARRLRQIEAGSLREANGLVVRLDRCEVPGCCRQGVPGNENRIGGKLVCDYCHAQRIAESV